MQAKLDVANKLSVNLQLAQSTKILQMSTAELVEYIAEEIVVNPVIDFDSLDNKCCSFEEIMDKSTLELLFQESSRLNTRHSDGHDNWIWNYAISKQETLAEHLMSQLLTSKLSRLEYQIAYYITASLDKNGYLTESPALIAAILDAPLDKVRMVLEMLKGLEPVGVCAGSLSECLLIQLRHIQADEITCKLASNHLDLVAKKRYDLIARNLGCTEKEAILSCKTISLLDPKPGSLFSSGEPTIFIEPDVYVVRENDKFSCAVRKDIFPKLSLSQDYLNLMEDKTPSDAKAYLRNCVQQANWLIHSIDQRRSTMQTVTSAIIKCQEPFFEYGPEMLKPLTLATISELTGFHESTVCRAINNKYLLCNWGIFPLKYFFPSSASSSGNATLTANQVKLYITRLISGEDKNFPLSDQTISEMLGRSGISVSRRTVAKYRGELGITSSSARKYAYSHEE